MQMYDNWKRNISKKKWHWTITFQGKRGKSTKWIKYWGYYFKKKKKNHLCSLGTLDTNFNGRSTRNERKIVKSNGKEDSTAMVTSLDFFALIIINDGLDFVIIFLKKVMIISFYLGNFFSKSFGCLCMFWTEFFLCKLTVSTVWVNLNLRYYRYVSKFSFQWIFSYNFA